MRTWVARGFFGAAAVAGLLGFSSASSAQVNLALNKPVIAGSGAWNTADHTAGQFQSTNIVDGDIDDSRDAETPEAIAYWLGRQDTPNEFLTVDLQGEFSVGLIQLQNSDNAGSADRGTAAFEVYAATSVDAGNNLVSPVLIASGTLADPRGLSTHPIQDFPLASPVNARYIRFEADTFYGAGSALGELQVFVPEPAGFALLALGAGAAFLRRGRRGRA